MSKALMKRNSAAAGAVPAIASAVIPGLGQVINGETDKAIGVFVVAGISGLSFLGAIPVLGGVAGLVWGATWIYGVADGYIQGRKK